MSNGKIFQIITIILNVLVILAWLFTFLMLIIFWQKTWVRDIVTILLALSVPITILVLTIYYMRKKQTPVAVHVVTMIITIITSLVQLTYLFGAYYDYFISLTINPNIEDVRFNAQTTAQYAGNNYWVYGNL